MAIADAHYKFLYVDVGGFGKQSDGGTIKACSLGRRLQDSTLDLPKPKLLPHSSDMECPHVFMTGNFMRPFPGKDLNKERRIYNYRHSRARYVVNKYLHRNECLLQIKSSKV